VGLVLEVGLSLQGHEHDLLAYIDGLIHANVSGTDGVVSVPGPFETFHAE